MDDLGPLRSYRAASESDSGVVPTRETSLALDARAVDLVPASVKLPQLQVTPTRRPSSASSELARPSQKERPAPSPLNVDSPARSRPARTSQSSDTRAKASLATDIIRWEHRVALLRKARRVQLANDRLDHDCTARLQQRAEKWREAGALAAELLADRYGVVVASSTFSSPPDRFSTTPKALFASTEEGDSNDDEATPASWSYAPADRSSSRSSAVAAASGPSHADRLEAFQRSITAAAHSRGISERKVLQQLEEEQGLDTLQSPEVEFDRLLPPTRRGPSDSVKLEDADATTDADPRFVRARTQIPDFEPPRPSEKGAFPSLTSTRPRAKELGAPPPPPLSASGPGEEEDSSGDELMRALDAVIAAGKQGRTFLHPPPPATASESARRSSPQAGKLLHDWAATPPPVAPSREASTARGATAAANADAGPAGPASKPSRRPRKVRKVDGAEAAARPSPLEVDEPANL
ncbi:hypothetical protein JCM3774_004400 [Rhodotorula dairenensis]